MKLTLLGTGTSQGVPVVGCECEVCCSTDTRDQRLRTSAMLETDDGLRIVFDAGPDFRQQMLRVGGRRIDAILITHEHNDHVAGLDDVRPFNFRYQMNMPVYGQPQVLEAIRLRYPYVFSESPYPGAPMIELLPIEKDAPFHVRNLQIQPIEVMHGGLPIFGFRVKDLTYLTDVKWISPIEIEKIKGTKTLIVNALHKKGHHSHFSLSEALDFIEVIAPERAYLLHISHTMGLHAALQTTLPKGVFAAYDGLEIDC